MGRSGTKDRMLKDRISADLKEAVAAQDGRRVCTLRLILAAIKDRDFAARAADSTEGIGDEGVRAILVRMVKQREESASAYEESGRLELAQQERDEIKILRSYLPRPMNEAEVAQAIKCAIRDVGATSIRDMGRCMARLKAQHPGRMDFAKAGAVLRNTLR
jgi:uncharacterized protein